MALVRVKHKGQVTIPAPIRARLLLAEGAMLEVTTDGHRIVLTPKAVVDREGPELDKGERSRRAPIRALGR